MLGAKCSKSDGKVPYGYFEDSSTRIDLQNLRVYHIEKLFYFLFRVFSRNDSFLYGGNDKLKL